MQAGFTDQSIKKVWSNISAGDNLEASRLPYRVSFLRDRQGVPAILFRFLEFVELHVSGSMGFEAEVSREDGATCLCIRSLLQKEDEELFYVFSGDLIQLVKDSSGLTQAECAEAVVDRISAWQSFMKTSRNGLSVAQEIGLYGELLILQKWLELGNLPEKLSSVWTGPVHGAHDFTFTDGRAIEVKTTLSDNPLIVKIDSILQLDTSKNNRLILTVVKLTEDDAGSDLKQLSQTVRKLLKKKSLQTEFDSALISLGYRVENPGRVLGKFSFDYVSSYAAETLPRIVYGTIKGIISARYEIQLPDEKESQEEGFTKIDLDDYLKRTD